VQRNLFDYCTLASYKMWMGKKLTFHFCTRLHTMIAAERSLSLFWLLLDQILCVKIMLFAIFGGEFGCVATRWKHPCSSANTQKRSSAVWMGNVLLLLTTRVLCKYLKRISINCVSFGNMRRGVPQAHWAPTGFNDVLLLLTDRFRKAVLHFEPISAMERVNVVTYT